VNAFKKAMAEEALAAGMHLSDPDSGLRLGLLFPWPYSPFWLMIESASPEAVMVRGVIRAEGLSGDRTDIHDILTALWAANLQASEAAELFIVDVPHPAVPYENHSRTILMAPPGSRDLHLPLEPSTIRWFRGVCKATVASIPLMAASFDDPLPESYVEKQPSWVRVVAEITGDDIENGEVSINHRLEGAIWQHFRSFASGSAVYRLTPAIMADVRSLLVERATEIEAGSARIESAIQEDDFEAQARERCELALEIAQAVDASCGIDEAEQPLLLKTRSHVFAVGKASIAEVSWSKPAADDSDEDDCRPY
jgi:hypothetical protein